MDPMAAALLGLRLLVGLVFLACLILVLIRIFQEGQTALGITCIVLFFCFGIGALIAFVFGWMRAVDWGLTKLMWLWTGCVVAGLLLVVAGVAVAPPPGFDFGPP
jgi:hypothetical protein